MKIRWNPYGHEDQVRNLAKHKDRFKRMVNTWLRAMRPSCMQFGENLIGTFADRAVPLAKVSQEYQYSDVIMVLYRLNGKRLFEIRFILTERRKR